MNHEKDAVCYTHGPRPFMINPYSAMQLMVEHGQVLEGKPPHCDEPMRFQWCKEASCFQVSARGTDWDTVTIVAIIGRMFRMPEQKPGPRVWEFEAKTGHARDLVSTALVIPIPDDVPRYRAVKVRLELV
jgi:hypothetical protein